MFGAYVPHVCTLTRARTHTHIHMCSSCPPKYVACGAVLDEEHLCSGSRNGDIFLWDSSTAKRTAKAHVNRNVITAVCWTPGDAGLVAQTSEDKILRLWDVRTMKPAHAYPRQQYIHVRVCTDTVPHVVCVQWRAV